MENKEQTSPDKVVIAKPVSQKTLNRVILFNDALVRPLKFPEFIKIDHVSYGEIIKLPSDGATSRTDEGEEWKRLINKETSFRIGDRVIYNSKTNVFLDGEKLHMVCYIIGKIKDKQNNS